MSEKGNINNGHELYFKNIIKMEVEGNVILPIIRYYGLLKFKENEQANSAWKTNMFVIEYLGKEFIKKIIQVEISNNILKYTLKTGESGIINIKPVSSYEEFLKQNSSNENKKLSKKDKDEKVIQSKEEKEEMLKGEKIFGGAAILVFASTGVAGTYAIKKIYYETPEGIKNVSFDIKNTFTGTKEALKSKTLKLLESKSVFLDTSIMKFEKILPHSQRIEHLKKITQKLTYEKYSEILKRLKHKPITKEQFEDLKIRTNQEILLQETKYTEYLKKQLKLTGDIKSDINQKTINEAISKTKILTKDQFILKSITLSRLLAGFGNAMHVVFLPVFFENIHHNSQDLVSIGKVGLEYGGFEAGVRLGSTIASKMPGVWGKIGGLTLGLVLGGIGASSLGFAGTTKKADILFWKTAPDREDWAEKNLGMTDKKSMIMHYVTNYGVAHDISDKAKGFGVFGKVDMSTNPREYMSAAYGRDVNFWNNKVDEYKNNLNKDFIKIIGEYKSGKYSSEYTGDDWIYYNKEQQKEIFKSKLLSAIGDGEFTGFDIFKLALIEAILNQIERPNFKNDDIKYTINNICDYMKLDAEGIRNMKTENNNLYIGLLLKINEESKKSQYPDAYKKLCTSILDRMIKHQPILTKGKLPGYSEIQKLDYYDGYDFSGQTETLCNSEYTFYSKLLDDPKTKTGFVNILNMILEYKRQKEFLDNIDTTGQAVKWGA